MNKKVSTLLTVALTLGGSLLSSSAFAESFPLNGELESVKNGDVVVYGQTTAGYGTELLGFFDKDGKTQVSVIKANDNSFDKKNLDNYRWKVYITQNDVQVKPLYTFVNVATGDTLSFDKTSGNVILPEKGVYSKDNRYSFFWTSKGETYPTENGRRFFDSTDEGGNAIQVSGGNQTVNLVADYDEESITRLYDVKADGVDADELNGFFNKKGFNLSVKYDEKEGKLAENIFGGDSRIYAFELESEYQLSKENVNGKDLIIPAGMYFFTKRVLVDGAVPTNGKYNADQIDWLASEFITVSPRETVETTVENRVEGQGFKLVPVKGSDFIYEKNTSEFKVADNPIWNACFSVSDNYSGYPYAINLEHFYFQESAKDAATDKLKETKIGLSVLAFEKEDTQYLTSKPGATEHIFKFSDSALKDGKELLKTTQEAAVYNLQFVAGTTTAEKKLVGKYLTVTNSGSNFEWVAKPYDITKVEHPAFQYTITNVEDEDKTDDVEKYTIITFTNRETNESFVAKLFPESEYGENCYSLAFVDGNTNIDKVTPLTVNVNNYAVSRQTSVNFTEDIIVKLIPAKVDEYAGFVNVPNGTVRTIRYARDKFDTSYQWYTNVNATENNGTVNYALSDKFVEDNYDAAQFYMKRSEKPSTIARTFVYNNETTKDVDDVPNGDKLSAYKYQLMYIADGTTSKYGLKDGAKLSLVNSSITDFYIRENADGSVSFFNADDNTFVSTQMRVATPSELNSVQVVLNTSKDGVRYVNTASPISDNYTNLYEDEFEATDIRTYLEGEAPVFSWPAENGHVSLRNNTTGVVGNYIVMNDSREGILVSNDADAFYLQATDKNAVVPSFFISKGKGQNSNASSERMFMFNPVDSVKYPVNMDFDPNYQLAKSQTKAIFKAGKLNDSYTKLNTWIKGENRDVAKYADNNGVWGGLDRFKFQIIETADHDGNYNIRQVAGSEVDENEEPKTVYLASNNEKLYFTTEKGLAMTINVESVEAPTSNEGVAASEVKVVAQDGAVVVKNAAGKNVVVSTILGQVVANEVLTSDNATINVPAGIVVVAVDGESFKVNVK